MITTRGLRGAIDVENDSLESITRATQELLRTIVQANPSLRPQDLASAFFTMTEDLTATYPALAARQLGWHDVPLLCAREIAVPGALPRVIRVLLHWNTRLPQSAIQHVYLHGAVSLRPDITSPNPAAPEPFRAPAQPFLEA